MRFGDVFPNEKKHKEHLREQLPHIPEAWLDRYMGAGLIGRSHRDTEHFVRFFEDVDQTALERRFQALALFPFMNKQPEFYALDGYEKTQRLKTFYRDIDNGVSAFTALQHFLEGTEYASLSRTHIKRLSNLQIPDFFPGLYALSTSAPTMDINAFPVTPVQASAMASLFNGLSDYTDDVRVHNGPSLQELWPRVAATLKASDCEKIDRINELTSVRNTGDTLIWIHNNILSPLQVESALNEGEDSDVMILEHMMFNALKTLSAVDIVTVNHVFHANWARLNRALTAYDEQQERHKLVKRWETKFPAADSKTLPELGKFKIVPLKSRAQLKQEHERLGGICIDGYSPDCIKGQSFCFSLRDKSGRSLSCFEIDKSGQLIQHEAFGGKKPPSDQIEAVDAYVDAIRDNRLTANPLYQNWLQKAENFSFVSVHGYYEGDPDRARHAIDLLINLESMPGRFKKALGAFKGDDTRAPRTAPAENPGLFL